MKEKLIKFLKTDLFYVSKGLSNETDIIERSKICWYARQRALGACEFANSLGLNFTEAIEPIYTAHCEELDRMEKDFCTGCDFEGRGSEHCTAMVGDYCQAAGDYIEETEEDREFLEGIVK